MKVYGPYFIKGNSGRQLVILIDENGSRRTVSYPKFLMEKYLGHRLEKHETVDHIDRNFENNEISNLRILDRSTHAKEDAIRRIKKVEVTCVLCQIKFIRDPRNLKGSHSQGKAGPFCSKSCSGKYGTMVQNGYPKFPVQPDQEINHYQIEKSPSSPTGRGI